MCYAVGNPAGETPKRNRFFVSDACHPQTIDVVQTRAKPLGIEVVVGDHETFAPTRRLRRALVQYPATDGVDPRLQAVRRSRRTRPARWSWSRPICSRSRSCRRRGIRRGHRGRQRATLRRAAGFRRTARGVLARRRMSSSADARPLGRRVEGCARQSRAAPRAADARAAHPPREGHQQHLHGAGAAGRHGRDVCVLSRAGGPARRSRAASTRWPAPLRRAWSGSVARLPRRVISTRCVIERGRTPGERVPSAAAEAEDQPPRVSMTHTVGTELRRDRPRQPTLTGSLGDLQRRRGDHASIRSRSMQRRRRRRIETRTSAFLTHPVFNRYHSETRDAALHQAARGEGSVALPLDDPARLVHDEAQRDERNVSGDLAGVRRACIRSRRPTRARGYREMFKQLETWLAEITGFAAVSLQPNAGSQGEYAGLLAIRAYHERAARVTATSA